MKVRKTNMELINGNLYFINEEMDNDVFNSYDVVQLLDVMADTGLALVQLNQAFGIIEDENLYLKTVLVDPRNLTEFEIPEPVDPTPMEPTVPEIPDEPVIDEPVIEEPEPVLPNVDEESEEKE